MRSDHPAQYWIDKLCLQPHPEGGFFRETYRSELSIEQVALPQGFEGVRAASTAIYFLLEGRDFSALHRLRSDEVWHFYAGSALLVSAIDQEGAVHETVLGAEPEADEELQAVVKAGCWFGSRTKEQDSFALVGCTVAPGFDFADFEMGKREELLKSYPQHAALIERLTRS